MENKLEQLLNSLIEKGWKPFGRNSNKAYYRPEWPDEFYFWENGYWYIYNRRQLVSKESWLWQFVCKNKFVKTKDRKVRFMYEDLERTQNYFSWHWYEYRVIESALKDESELEDFLLSNIKL